MKTVRISLNSIDMGIFSLDLSKPIDLNIHSETEINDILTILAPYIV